MPQFYFLMKFSQTVFLMISYNTVVLLISLNYETDFMVLSNIFPICCEEDVFHINE